MERPLPSLLSLPPHRAKRLLIIILIVAIGLRVGFVMLFGHTLSLQASGYDVYAVNLMEGHGYTRFADLHPDSDIPPLYSFFLVSVYSLLGRSPINVALVQIIFDCMTIYGVYAIGKRVGKERGHLVGMLAAAFTAFYPYLLFQGVSTNDTSLFITLLVGGIWATYIMIERNQLRWAALTGFLFGVAALTKTLALLTLPVIALFWLRHLGWRRAVISTLVAGMLCLAAIAPWVARNITLHQAFVLISTNDGSNLYQGNNPCVADYLLNGWDAQWVDCMKPTPVGLSELEEVRWYRDQALSYLRDHPNQWLRLALVKLWTLWSPELLPRTVPATALPKRVDDAVDLYETPLFQTARSVHLLYYTPLWLLGIIGLWLAWRDQRPILPLLGVFFSITIAYVIYHPSTRYRSPADPFVFILSAYAIVYIAQRGRR